MEANAYKVWVKGKKAETERVEFGLYKINALLRLANAYGLKTIQCDGRLIKRHVSQANRYFFSTMLVNNPLPPQFDPLDD